MRVHGRVGVTLVLYMKNRHMLCKWPCHALTDGLAALAMVEERMMIASESVHVEYEKSTSISWEGKRSVFIICMLFSLFLFYLSLTSSSSSKPGWIHCHSFLMSDSGIAARLDQISSYEATGAAIVSATTALRPSLTSSRVSQQTCITFTLHSVAASSGGVN